MNFDFEVRKLSLEFFNDYPSDEFPELMTKEDRPYTCLCIEHKEGYLICIPFRTHIRHKYAVKFKTSRRSQTNESGVDFSKIVVIEDMKYIDNNIAVVDNDEYIETVTRIEEIASEANDYIDKYIKHISGNEQMHEREFARKYSCSTLKYFENILLKKNEDI